MRKLFIAAALVPAFVVGVLVPALVFGVLVASLITAAAPAFAVDAPKAVYSSAESEIGTLLDNPDTCAIVDKHMPGFSKRDQIDQSRPFTLRGIQQYAPDLITDDALTKIDADLAKLPAK